MNGLHRCPQVINQVKAALWTAIIDALPPPPTHPRTINQDKATIWRAFSDAPKWLTRNLHGTGKAAVNIIH